MTHMLYFVFTIIVVLLSHNGIHGFKNYVRSINSRLTINYCGPSDDLENIKQSIRRRAPMTVVIKYGGHAMENEELKLHFCVDIAILCDLGITPVLVHGGGPQIASMLKKLNIESKFVQGLRVTDKATLEVAQMVLCGSINKDITRILSSQKNIRGAIGICGLDSKLISAKLVDKVTIINAQGAEEVADLGFVGEPTKVNSAIITDLLSKSLVPVIAPIGYNEDYNNESEGNGSLNINADTAAGAVAESIKADRLLLLTDIMGVLDKDKQLVPKLTTSMFASMKSDGSITGGMIPKLETAVQAVNNGVKVATIVDGRVRHAVLRALASDSDSASFGTTVLQ